MAPPKRPILADEELGKKDDDRRPKTSPAQLWQPKQWKAPRRRRILLAFVILYFLYLFFKHMPTDLPPVTERLKGKVPSSTFQQFENPRPAPPAIPQSGPPPRGEFEVGNKDELYYDGDIHFHRLGASLKLFKKPPGRDSKVASTATVFAAASLRSVSDLLPLACLMANEKLNDVHFLLMGRDDVSIEGIQQVNGINNMNCPVNWHDARVDYSTWSTDTRMEQAIATVLPYAQTYLRPQVILTQGESWEEPFFWRGIQKARDLEIPHIALPRASRDLMWMAALDSNALRAWNNVHVEFLIYAAPESAGSFIRLIRSLQHADFLGFSPSLTIELPSRVDPELLRFLKTIKWPPNASLKVTIRRRMQQHDMGLAKASVKAVEAFYPRDPELSHVLVLSPDMELAPSFYHYLTYTILKYKYSAQSKVLASKLMGISLELPSSPLTSTGPFKHPNIDDTQFSTLNNPDSLPLFLWQAPNSNAALYFGDKWVEIHSFLSRLLESQGMDYDSLLNDKVMSKKYPAFMELFLELIRAKGYYLLYPAFSDKGRFPLATFHDELSQLPEESAQDIAGPPSTESSSQSNDWERPLNHATTIMPLLGKFSMELPDISRLPVLSYRGEEMSDLVFTRDTQDYLGKFRVRYGGCRDDSVDTLTTDNLFCVD